MKFANQLTIVAIFLVLAVFSCSHTTCPKFDHRQQGSLLSLHLKEPVLANRYMITILNQNGEIADYDLFRYPGIMRVKSIVHILPEDMRDGGRYLVRVTINLESYEKEIQIAPCREQPYDIIKAKE